MELLALLEPKYNTYARQKQRFVCHNFRLVLKVCGKSVKRGLAIQDLFQEGVMGLMRGVDRYCYLKGFRFSTYATWWIRQSINRAIAEKARHIRVPVHMQEMLTRIHRAREKYHADFEHEPSPEQLAKLLNEPLKKIKEALACEPEVSSLHEKIGNSESETVVVDMIEDQSAVAPDEGANISLLRENMETILADLGDRERQVIEYRFGLKDGNALTLEQVGHTLHITRERVRQIQEKALRKLKHPNKLKRLLGEPNLLLKRIKKPI
jgi:RNA polymerase primary sigma factor